MRALLTLTFLAFATAAAAQETSPPVLPSETPAQPAPPAPAVENSPAPQFTQEAAPAAPATPEAPAAPAQATPQANQQSAAPSEAGTAPAAPAAETANAPEASAPATAQAPATLATDATTAPLAPAAAPQPEVASEPVMPTDLYSIVLHAHWVVQAVMAGLALAAFAVLVIFLHKTVEFALSFRNLSRTARVLSASSSLGEARSATLTHKGPAAEMIRAAAEELELAEADPALKEGVRDRTAIAVSRIEAGAAHGLRGGTGILASIGSLSPFIGLFGTVFGIMNSFLAIAESKTTNLAVVAPGIAEALFATAIGLAAAIPAVLVYNICSRRLAKYRLRMNDVAAGAQRLQSRALDHLAAKLGK